MSNESKITSVTPLDIEECGGKTIRKALVGTYAFLLVAYTDGTFSVIGINNGYDGTDNEIGTTPGFCRSDFPDADLKELFSEEIIQKWEAEDQEQRERRKAVHQNREKAEYERLAKIYGAKP